VLLLPQGGYDHFMQKEIHEQPESILQTMRGRVVLGLAGQVGGKGNQGKCPLGEHGPPGTV
jgi:glucosamine 6-phosphate synthetase-like amidotransferase/phosphosugar isomerase protein